MKKIFVIILFFIFSNCKVIMSPVQQSRESNKYTRLLSGQLLTQRVYDISKGFNGIVLLISGKCENLSIRILDAENNKILLNREMKSFFGNVRKTSYIRFNNELERNYKRLLLQLSCSNGYLLLGSKIEKNELNNLRIDSNETTEILYYRSVYNLNFKNLIYSILTKFFKNKIFVFVYFIGILLFIYLYFSKKENKIYKFFPKNMVKTEEFFMFKNILVIGLLLRFLVSPFFLHIDMSSGLWVPYMMYYHDPLYYATDPGASFHLINQLFHMPFMMFSKYIFPSLYELWEKQPYGYTAQTVYEMCKSTSIHLLLLLNKIPYLIADILFFILLCKYLNKTKNLKKALWLWALNPLSFYVVYMIGRFELYAIIFIMLGIINFQREKKFKGMLFFGIAAAFRQYPILFLPYLLILYSKKIKDYVINILMFSLPVILYNIGHNLPAKLGNMKFESPTGVVANDAHSNMLFHYNIKHIVLFAFFYFLILLFIWNKKNELKEKVCSIIFIFFNIMFAFSAIEPQYYMWVTPFLIVMYAKEYIKIEEIILFVLLFFGMVLQWDKAFSTFLAMPVYPELFYYLPAPERVINEFYPALIVNQLIVSFFTALNIYWMIKIFKKDKIY